MQYNRSANRGEVISDNHRYYRVSGLHPNEPQHDVCIPEEAIADRMQLYGLTTEQDAIDHIMWEHHIRLNPNMTTQAAQMPANVKANFDRVWGPGHKAARNLPMTASEQAEQARRLQQIYAPKEPEQRGGRRVE